MGCSLLLLLSLLLGTYVVYELIYMHVCIYMGSLGGPGGLECYLRGCLYRSTKKTDTSIGPTREYSYPERENDPTGGGMRIA